MNSSSKANWRFRFSPQSVISVDLLGNRNLLKRVQKVMMCDLRLVDFDPFCGFCVSRFVACDRDYYWRQRKTQLWRRLLNFRVRVFVKAQKCTLFFCSNRSLFLEQIWAHVKLQAVKCIQETDISLGNANKRASPWVNNNQNHFQVESTVCNVGKPWL